MRHVRKGGRESNLDVGFSSTTEWKRFSDFRADLAVYSACKLQTDE